MEFLDTMKALHAQSDELFLNILNKATYVENCSELKKLFSTGVSFKIHTGTTFELLYDYIDDEIYFQPNHVISIPLIAGLIVTKSNSIFFNEYIHDSLISKVWIDKLETIKTSDVELFSNQYFHKFEIIDENEDSIHHFQLSLRYPKEIYNGVKAFEIR
jgi:hypothetical protein